MIILSIAFLIILAIALSKPLYIYIERDYAHNHSNAEVLDNKAKIAKKAMRIDEINNMNSRIADGSWESTKQVRTKWSANPACLLDKNNKLRGAAERAAVLGEYLATEQFGHDPNHSYSIPRVLNGYALAPGVNLVIFLLISN